MEDGRVMIRGQSESVVMGLRMRCKCKFIQRDAESLSCPSAGGEVGKL